MKTNKKDELSLVNRLLIIDINPMIGPRNMGK